MTFVTIAEKKIQYLEAVETEEYYNGGSRRTLTVTCPCGAIGVDELNALLTEDNLASIKMENDELDIVNVYDNYVLKLECGVKKVLVKLETPDSSAKYEDRVIFKIARRTYIEEQLHQLGL